MRALVALFLISPLAFAPTASACSLVHQPYDQALTAPDGAIWAVDGDRLLRIQGPQETVIESGFFLTYGFTSDGVLVAGQDGLGADCSGDRWLRHIVDGEVAWEEQATATVLHHPNGLLVHKRSTLYTWDDGLVRHGSVPKDVYLLGLTHDRKAIYDNEGRLHVGDVTIDRPGWAKTAFSHDTTGVLTMEEGKARLHRFGAEEGVLSWTTKQYGHHDLAHAGGWFAIAAGDAYFIDGDGVTRLKEDQSSVGADDGQGLVFSDQGYTVFEGTQAVSAQQRVQGAWVPAQAQAEATPVDAQAEPAATQAPSPGRPPTDEQDSPAVALAFLATFLVAVAWVRRR